MARGAFKMGEIVIRQAREGDVFDIERVMLDAVRWLIELGQPLWGEDEVRWDSLSKKHAAGDFHIAYMDGEPSGCLAIIDYDPFFWPDIRKGESLFIHKFAVTKAARKTGVSDALINYSKKLCAVLHIKTLRLDTDAQRPKTRAFYERHGFELAGLRSVGDFHQAFYVYTLPTENEDGKESENI